MDRRLQVLIDEERWGRLDAEARRRGVPVAVLVREAIDARFPADEARRQAAFKAILEAEPMDVPDPPELKKELEALRGRRFP